MAEESKYLSHNYDIKEARHERMEWRVTYPNDGKLKDLLNPDYWRLKVTGSRIQVGDIIEAIREDMQEYYVFLVVARADKSLTLAKINQIEPISDDVSSDNPDYVVKMKKGKGWCVYKADAPTIAVTEGLPSKEDAMIWIHKHIG